MSNVLPFPADTNVLTINPKVHFPKLTVFKTGDGFNKERGTYFYRDVQGDIRGPFKSSLTASLDLLKTNPTSGAPMRTPFEQDGVWWWKRDTPTGVIIEGPYQCEGEAQASVLNFVQMLKDEATHEYR